MIDARQTPILRRLDDRRRQLGLTLAEVANATGLSMPTVTRILSGRQSHASWSNVIAIAHVLGLNVEFKPIAPVEELRHRQAERKADELVGMLQATSALEAQGLDEDQRKQLRQQTIHDLLAGSSRRLWGK